MKILTAQNRNIILVALFIMIAGNFALGHRILEIYPLNAANFTFLLSLFSFFTITTTMFFLAICHGKWARWLLAIFIFVAAQAAYYMDQFGVIIDTEMIDTMLQTNAREFAGLISTNLIIRTLLLGVLPAWLVIKYWPTVLNFNTELKSKGKLLLILLVLMIAVVAPFTAGYASFIREHKITRMYANPTFFSYSIVKYIALVTASKDIPAFTKTATDTVKLSQPNQKNTLMIMVVGETARADRFSLNGYHRETNPLLKQQDIVSFSNVASCGTSTSISVPCMFSVLTRKEFNKEKALYMENALDVLARNGVEVLWRDNNSDSKGVATRLKYENFQSPTLNKSCEEECRDIGMLGGLDKYIASKKGKGILVVLHMMGNHGPEYYRRYPKSFKRFTPICESSDLRVCSQQEIDNAYDNAILYTDYFLSSTIDLLKKYDDNYETAMFYVSDHGESLGEHGFYLHAAPYAIAPKEQTHVPAVLWLGKNMGYSMSQVKPYQDYALSHDDLFCMLLVGYKLETQTCKAKQDILYNNSYLKDSVKN